MTLRTKILSVAVAAVALTTAQGADIPLPTMPPGTNPAPKSLAELFGDNVVAKGTGVEIKRSELDAEAMNRKGMYAQKGYPAPPDLDAQVLDELIGMRLILNKATDDDKAKGKEQFEEDFKKFKEARKMSDAEFDEQLNRDLKLQNITRDEWQKRNVEQYTLPIVLARELKVAITDEDAKKYYDENPARFEQPETVKACHLLLLTKDPTDPTPNPVLKKDLAPDVIEKKKKLIEDLLKRARGGEDFTKLVKEYSEDPGVKDNNGEYTFSRGQMESAFEGAAFSLGTNQISDVVKTPYGFHIIKVLEKTPAQKIELAKVLEPVKDDLKREAIRKKMPDYITDLKKTAKVEILDERYKIADPFDLKPSAPTSAKPDAPK